MLLCVLGFWPWPYIKMIFPLLLASFLPIRTIILPKIIESKYLQVIFFSRTGSFLCLLSHVFLLSGAGRGASLTSTDSSGSQQFAGVLPSFSLLIQWDTPVKTKCLLRHPLVSIQPQHTGEERVNGEGGECGAKEFELGGKVGIFLSTR